MPTTTRESRALLSFTLSVTFLVGGLTDLGFTLYGGLQAVLGSVFPFDSGNTVGVVIAVLVLLLSVTLLVVARSSAKAGPQDDAWHHLGVAATWVATLLVAMALVALVGALGAGWPFMRMAG